MNILSNEFSRDLWLSHQLNSLVADKSSAAATAEQQYDLHYASIHFALTQNDDLYSNIGPFQPHGHIEEEDDEEDVEYSDIKPDSASCTLRWAVLLT